ncbi:MAG: hypothetical protein WED34_04835 [Planctomycetales bacterium]
MANRNPTSALTAAKHRRTIGPMKNGATAFRLRLGELPTSMAGVTKSVRGYRSDLEAVVMDAKGEIDARDAHFISAAATHEQHALICMWLLRKKIESMADDDIIKCSAAIAQARDARNKALDRLQLEGDPNVIDVLYALPPVVLPVARQSANGSPTSPPAVTFPESRPFPQPTTANATRAAVCDVVVDPAPSPSPGPDPVLPPQQESHE